MLVGSKQGTPFEIVALEALFARWVGVPSRIGYGFDADANPGGSCAFADGKLDVRPACSATFPEFYFQGYGWIPINKAPTKQKPTLGKDSAQRKNSAQAATEISVQLYLPVVKPVRSVLAQQLLRTVLALALLLLLVGLGYVLFPLLAKARARSRRRAYVEQLGPRARLALAYAEWRDAATDFGYRRDGDTPLMFVDRVAEDAEHLELAWLVTRGLYGDLRDDLSDAEVAAAEELSRALRRRLAAAHPATVRVVAALSRLSVRHPYAPGLEPPARTRTPRKERRRDVTPHPA
jgi:hypothetical protein